MIRIFLLENFSARVPRIKIKPRLMSLLFLLAGLLALNFVLLELIYASDLVSILTGAQAPLLAIDHFIEIKEL